MSIKFALLSLLAEEPASVGHLRSTFEERTGHTWPVNVGQVYQTVQRLTRDGLVEVTGTEAGQSGRHTDLFAPTAAGLAELRDWWEAPVLPPRNDRDDLVIKTAMAASSPPGQLPEDLTLLIHRQRLATLDELRTLTTEKAATPAVRSADRLLLERRIFDLESQIRWLDHIETLPPAPTTPED
jgi:DNA-binding PadR family transcriptional regulator